MDVEHREVIIVGAGPAGATCAQRLAEEGIDVLILERRAIVGNPAHCLLYTSPSPRDVNRSRMPSSA